MQQFNFLGTMPSMWTDGVDPVVAAWKRLDARLRRTAAVLEGSRIPHAFCGETAASAYERFTEISAERVAPLVNVLIRRTDFEAVRQSLILAGLVHRLENGVNYFVDTPASNLRSAVVIHFALERNSPKDRCAAPDVEAFVRIEDLRVLPIDSLVPMLLSRFSRVDRINLRDLADIGLVDGSWLTRVPPELAPRLQHILDTPEG